MTAIATPKNPSPPPVAVPAGVELKGALAPGYSEILTTEALRFVAELERRFGTSRRLLLEARKARQAALDAGERPGFLPETKAVREGTWRTASIPADLTDRRVEITGPTDRKMVINALNSGANVFMADFEDANAPTFANMIEGQINLRDAIRRAIGFSDPATGKQYALNDKVATLIVRPRGWHLAENHLLVDGKPMSGSLFDFGLFLFHNGAEALKRGSGPYFYLPKLEGHKEAGLWAEVFGFAEDRLGIRRGSIRCTVLIETILAAFEMDEILYELRDYIVGLNCGRWDYIFSFIKKFRNRPEMVLPDRASVTMTKPFLKAYSQLLIQTCHRRGAYAMGGMAAQIPIKNDPAANEAALGKVRADKEREAGDGHDGTWVAHPGLVPIAKAVFDEKMPKPNQLERTLDNLVVTAGDLIAVPEGKITEAGLRQNINVGIQYIEAWLRGQGCVPIYNLMEDAATAEISRAQVWQWLRHGATLDDGRRLDRALFDATLAREAEALKAEIGAERFERGRFADAIALFAKLSTDEAFAEFLTLPAYDLLIGAEPAAP
ncbi:MAG: malate synthase A [Alphaproteobacteria bacterium]